MSTPNERLDAIQQTYLDAQNNEAADLAKAQTAADVTAVQANVANARSTYFSAVAAALTANSAAVETALTNAKSTLTAVQNARAAAGQIPALLTDLNNATSAATTLLNLAKS